MLTILKKTFFDTIYGHTLYNLKHPAAAPKALFAQLFLKVDKGNKCAIIIYSNITII